jgi:hypothetical protein
MDNERIRKSRGKGTHGKKKDVKEIAKGLTKYLPVSMMEKKKIIEIKN